MGAREFAKEAMAAKGRIARSLDGGKCPSAGGDGEDGSDERAEADDDSVPSNKTTRMTAMITRPPTFHGCGVLIILTHCE